MQNFFPVVILSFIVIIHLLLAALIFVRNRHSEANISFGIFIFSISFWAVTNLFFQISESHLMVIVWAQLSYVSAIFLAGSISYFSLVFPSKSFIKSRFLARFYRYFIILPSLFLLIVIFVPDFVLIDVSISDSSRAIITGGGLIFYALFLLLFFGWTLYNLFSRFFKSSGVQRSQVLYVLTGLLFAIFFGVFFNLILPILGYYDFVWLGPDFAIFLVISTSYAIIRYRLLNVRLVVARSLLYFFLVFFVALTYTLLTILIGKYFQDVLNVNTIAITIATSTLIVITLEPLKNGISYVTDSVFFRRKIDYTAALKRMVTILNTEIELEPLISSLKENLPHELKLKSVAFVLPNKRGGGYSSKGFGGDDIIRLGPLNPLLTYIKKNPEILVLEEFQRKVADTSPGRLRKRLEDVQEHFEEVGYSVAVPIIMQEEISGFILVGERLSGEAFSTEDINFFQVLSPQVGTAISKAQLYQQVKDFNVKLKKRVDRATKQLKETNADLQKRNHFLSALQHITNLIIKSFDFQKVSQILVDEIHKELGYIGGILYFTDKSKKHLQVRAVTRSPQTNRAIELLPKDYVQYKLPIKGESCYLSRCFREKKMVMGTNFRDFTSSGFPDELADKIQKVIGMRSGVAVPVFDEEEVVGVLYYFVQTRKQAITPLDKQMMRALAGQTGIFARNLRLVEEVKHYNSKLKVANDHLRQLDKAKSEFMSIASHQLRTPMSGIMGYLSMLLEGDYGKFKKEQHVILESIMEASQRMIRLVNVFLNVTRIESGRLKLQHSEINMLDLIDEEVKELLITAKDKNIDLVYKRPKKDFKTVIGDADKIKDIVINLVDNAIKYTPKGSVTVTAKQKKTGVHVTVKDTGIGITKGEDKKLFQKFVRGSGIAQVQPDGSGLGLFIAKKVVEAHGGDIFVESEGKGKGSSFQFVLPFVSKDYKKAEK